MTNAPHIPVSWGELIDKLTILEIKAQRLTDPVARANVEKERGFLAAAAAPILKDNLLELKSALKIVNEALWEIEDHIREKERVADFGPDFIALARSVYKQNDTRAAIKRSINQELKSELVEEKSYQPY